MLKDYMKEENSKQMRKNWERYCESSDTELSDVYGRYSESKIKAYENCKKIFNECCGYDFRIVSHNSDFFSVGFKVNISFCGVIYVHITKFGAKYILVQQY